MTVNAGAGAAPPGGRAQEAVPLSASTHPGLGVGLGAGYGAAPGVFGAGGGAAAPTQGQFMGGAAPHSCGSTSSVSPPLHPSAPVSDPQEGFAAGAASTGAAGVHGHAAAGNYRYTPGLVPGGGLPLHQQQQFHSTVYGHGAAATASHVLPQGARLSHGRHNGGGGAVYTATGEMRRACAGVLVKIVNGNMGRSIVFVL